MVELNDEMRSAATGEMDLEAITSATRVDPIPAADPHVLYRVVNGDLRIESNRAGWQAQSESNASLDIVVANLKGEDGQSLGYSIKPAHDFDPEKRHGFIDGQAMGNDIFSRIPKGATIIVQESVWQYSHHILGALAQHIRNGGKVITVANYSGTWPGLVGMSNLNASLIKEGFELGKHFHTVWAEDFNEPTFQKHLRDILTTGSRLYDQSHIHQYEDMRFTLDEKGYGFDMKRGAEIAVHLNSNRKRAVMLGLDFVCMGMYNGNFAPEKLTPLGIGHEYASQSELLAGMGEIKDPDGIKERLYGKLGVTDEEGWKVIEWCKAKGMTFKGLDLEHEAELYAKFDAAKQSGVAANIETALIEIVEWEKEHLTKRQLIEQGKMYIAAVKMADKFGAEVIGIQCQQGLKNCCAASDLVEGLLNSTDRYEVRNDKGEVIRKGEAIPCFNEVDQGCGVDLILSKRVWEAYREGVRGMQSFSANQEDVRWSRKYSGIASARDTKGNIKDITLDNVEVWIDELSGSCPADHIKGGWPEVIGNRQPYHFFKSGGSTLSGYAQEGEVVISRVYQNHKGEMCINLMRGAVVNLPDDETQDRLQKTTPQWPIKSLVRYGVDRDQMLLHPSNHETVMYAANAEMANKLLIAKAEEARTLGMKVEIWGSLDHKDTIEFKANQSSSICSTYTPVRKAG